MREQDILYQNGKHWVMKKGNLYYVMIDGITHAESEQTAYLALSHATARADYLERKAA